MCGIAGAFGPSWNRLQLKAMIAAQQHRGPDSAGVHVSSGGQAGLGHNRLSIIDLSEAGRQPMKSADGNRWIVFNGEIYNYLELRRELFDYPYRSQTDTEVVLAAYDHWGEACLERFIGMFAFVIWDEREQRMFAARDRFGVKPFYYHQQADGTLFVASEIKALHAAGVPRSPDETVWATYLAAGVYDHTDHTFWEHVRQLPAGNSMTWNGGRTAISQWYDLAAASGQDCDERPLDTVAEEYLSLLGESVRLRFRSDVPVGINLSGGLDSSVLLGLVQAAQGTGSIVKAFTFSTGDPRYDELPWVREMLARTQHPSIVCRLTAQEVPELAESVQRHQDEPFGGMATLAYARLFERAREEGVIVLLDGQGLDEQWAGYDYYLHALNGHCKCLETTGTVQGTRMRSTRPECLTDDFRAAAEPFEPRRRFADALRNLQYRDACQTKIPRALRFNDRVSMRASTELREPFLDHRLFQLALRQPAERKIVGTTQKWMLRKIIQGLLPECVAEAPKRPLQTCQREWLSGELRGWAEDCIESAVARRGGEWFDAELVRREWHAYQRGESDNSFYVWQWISVGLMQA